MATKTKKPDTNKGIYRRAYGSGHGYKIDGEKAIGVTTLIKGGLPAPALMHWAGLEVAKAATYHANKYKDLEGEAKVRALKEAPFASRDLAAKRGTEVHALAERLANGETVEVPEEIEGHVDSYLDWRERWQPYDEIIEGVCASRKHMYAGTFDGIATFDNWPGHDGPARVLYDIKTSRSGIFSETVLQLAAYRHAEAYVRDWQGAGEELPMPQVDYCAALWVKADTYSFKPIEADAYAFRRFLYVAEVARAAGTGLQKGEVSPLEQRIKPALKAPTN